MSTYRTPRVPASEITPNSIWLRRRELLATGAEATFFLLAPSLASAMPLKAAKSMYTVTDKLTPKKDVTSYNNFYEFGVGKSDPSRGCSGRLQAIALEPSRWTAWLESLAQ